MQTGALTQSIDVAQVALYLFWGFFAALIIYLRKEDKREGYPLVSDRKYRLPMEGFPRMPKPKTFLLPHGGTVSAPAVEPPQPEFLAEPVTVGIGAPLQPIGLGMLSGAGPSAYALRADRPDLTYEDGANRIVPLRVATDYHVPRASPNPIGMDIIGADAVVGGVVTDLWIDRAEAVIRYLEVTNVAGFSVLVPMPLALVHPERRQVSLQCVLGSQIALAPTTAEPDQVTLREEDRIAAFFASGHLYAEPSRLEPKW